MYSFKPDKSSIIRKQECLKTEGESIFCSEYWVSDLHVKSLHQAPSVARAAHQTHSLRGLVDHGALLGGIRRTWQQKII